MENGKGAAGMGLAANGNGIEKVAQKIFGKQLDLSCAFCQTFCIIYCEIIELMKCALCDASKKTRVSVGGRGGGQDKALRLRFRLRLRANLCRRARLGCAINRATNRIATCNKS